MYKLSRFFVSDIVAGENILRNGYFPVFRENEQADHGIIVAANGSCKTTLLSFLFSVFTPDRRRFVQYLQSGGDKMLEQYLVPGRPAVVMLNLSMNLRPTLFEEQPREHLVLGQLFYRHKTAPDKIERSCFIADAPAFFDGLRLEWETLSRSDRPHAAIKDFLKDKVYQTGSHKEWRDKLESLGLDPWLVNRQVDFSRSEGGIKESFKFGSEKEFLSFFLGCVADLDAAMGLRKNTAQTMEKMKNRPEKKKQLQAVLSLKKRLADFHDMGGEWRAAQSEMTDFKCRLSEAVYLLTTAGEAADRALAASEAAVQNNREEQKSARLDRDTARANQVWVETFSHTREIEVLKARIQKAAGELKTGQKEREALRAAEYMASLRQLRALEESKEKILAGKDSLLKPARKEMDLRAAQYHARLLSQRTEIFSAVTTMEKEITAAEDTRQSLKEKQSAQAREMQTLSGTLARLKAQIKAAGVAKDNLGLAPGEDPREMPTLLEKDIRDCEESLARTTTRLGELDALQTRTQIRWQDLHRTRIQAEEALKKAREQEAQEKTRRAELLGNARLQTIAGSATFAPTRADLLSGLVESLARTRNRLETLQIQLLAVETEWKHLDTMNALVVDAPVAQLISHYTALGVSPAELKSFPEYLAGLDKTPEEIAGVVERDPGRFTGLMATTDAVIEKIKSLPVPDGLHKPVVISTPRDLFSEQRIAFPVITPKDPVVYGRTFLETQKQTLGRQQEKLKARLSEKSAGMRSLETAQRRLQAYRDKYPDTAAVERLARNVETAGETLLGITSDIRTVEKERERLSAEKREMDALFQRETRNLDRLKQLQKQIQNWLDQYGGMETWETSLAREEMKQVERVHASNQNGEAQKKTEDLLARLHGAVVEKKARLKSLEERADDIPVADKVALTADQKTQALSMDLSTLRKAHEQACGDVIRIAGDLGIDAVRSDLQRLQAKRQKVANDLKRHREKEIIDENTAEKWAGKSSRDRDERMAEIAMLLEDIKTRRAVCEGRLEGRERDAVRCRDKRNALTERGIHGDLDPADLEHADVDGLISHYGGVADAKEEKRRTLNRLAVRLAAALENNQRWKNELKLALATVGDHAPDREGLSPGGKWPELIRVDDPAACAVAFRKKMEKIQNARTQAASLVEIARKNMGRAFERLQVQLRDETFKQQLPLIVDELSRHDAESLGEQSGELMAKCNHIAANIESDLSRSSRFVETLVDQLLQHARVCHQKVRIASQQLMPENVFIYGGKPILKAGTRLDFTRHGEAFQKSIDAWLDELIQKNQIPEVNAGVGDTLGTALLYRLLKISSAKQEFGIRLLKCDDTGRNYAPVGKDLGSGGEALTTAVLLYSLLTAMRRKRRSNKDERIPSFLIADNPLGVCNRSDFLDAQLKVARAMGIQCIYFTGINDRESLGLFQHRVAIRHSGSHLQVDGKSCNCLEVIEQNVENQADGS